MAYVALYPGGQEQMQGRVGSRGSVEEAAVDVEQSAVCPTNLCQRVCPSSARQAPAFVEDGAAMYPPQPSMLEPPRQRGTLCTSGCLNLTLVVVAVCAVALAVTRMAARTTTPGPPSQSAMDDGPDCQVLQQMSASQRSWCCAHQFVGCGEDGAGAGAVAVGQYPGQYPSTNTGSQAGAYDGAPQAQATVADGGVVAVPQVEPQANAGESHRMCMDLPGVRLKGDKHLETEGPDDKTPESCRELCEQHAQCKQSIFSQGNQGCYLFREAVAEAQEFSPSFNSTFCGGLEDKAELKAMLDKVYKTMPYVPPIRDCAWAGDDCSKSKCCANVPVPNWLFTQFRWYSCYKKDQWFASCQLDGAPAGWDGEVLGHMGTREVPKANDGVLTQGTSLFCFCVVMWGNPPTKPFWDSEAALANNIKNTHRSIMACDEHAFFEGSALGYGDVSSINNIDSFIGAWEKVRQDGRWQQHDWTVKVDADAVFFPDRLRMHIEALRTPQGSRVYLRNINFKFQFLGAIEVLTKQGLQRYFEKSMVCKDKVGHQGGEDYYMLSCLDGIGIDHQTDFQLLNDKYAATGNCNDGWVVAFHFYKKVSSWNACHDAAVNSAKANGKFWWQHE